MSEVKKQQDDKYLLKNFLKFSEESQAEIYLGVAQELFKQGKTRLAIECMTRAVNIDPKIGKWLITGEDDWD